MTSAEMVVVGMKHIVCFSGGHSSAIAAVEVVRKFGAEDTILLNHDLCPRTEDADIKRFKKQVSDYLGVPITYANMPGWYVKDQFDVCMEIKAFKAGAQSTAFCTNRLKTEPFHKWLSEHYPANPPEVRDDISLVYGFDANEQHRVITNPPFSLAKEFAEKALEVSTGKVILFAKIQFLEGRQRKDFFATHPPKAVYVFSKRVNPLRNGLEVDENGKPWSSTMCFAWFVWEHGYTGEPCIRWI